MIDPAKDTSALVPTDVGPTISDAALAAFRQGLGCEPEGGHCDIMCNDCLRGALLAFLKASEIQTVRMVVAPPHAITGAGRRLFTFADVGYIVLGMATVAALLFGVLRACA